MKTYDTADELAADVAKAFCELAHRSVAHLGVFRVSLSGGSTPKLLYQLLAKRDLPWDKIEFFWGDERNVPPHHADSNQHMVCTALLDFVPEESLRAFPVPVDTEHPDHAAGQYEATLRRIFAGQAFPQWDLCLLGLGDDAHTASLFPETSALTETQRWFVANYVPKFNQYRYTLTAPAINSAREKWFLVTGANKREALRQARAGESSQPIHPTLYPSQLIHATRWFLTNDTIIE